MHRPDRTRKYLRGSAAVTRVCQADTASFSSNILTAVAMLMQIYQGACKTAFVQFRNALLLAVATAVAAVAAI